MPASLSRTMRPGARSRSNYDDDAPLLSLDDFQRLVSDAFDLGNLPLAFASAPGGDDEHPLLTGPRRRSTPSYTSMAFAAPSPTPSSLLRRRRHASLAPPHTFSLDPHRRSRSLSSIPSMANALASTSSPRHDPYKPGFFRALKTRASNLLRSSRLETGPEQVDDTFDVAYTFPPSGPSSPPRMKPGRYATSPKAWVKNRTSARSSGDIATRPAPKRTSSVPLDLLCPQEKQVELPDYPDPRDSSREEVGDIDASDGTKPLSVNVLSPSPPLSSSPMRLKTVKSLHHIRPRLASSHIRRNSGSQLTPAPSKPHPAVVSSGLVKGSDGEGIVSLGLGIEFFEAELDERCPDPYVNPRPAPLPPAEASVAARISDPDDIDVPAYVFERRGSATSNCTVSSTRSTRTLKERLSSIVTIPAVRHIPSVRSLKLSKLRTRSKLNIAVPAASVGTPCARGRSSASSNVSQQTPPMKSARSHDSERSFDTDASSPTSADGSLPPTPSTPSYFVGSPSNIDARSAIGYGYRTVSTGSYSATTSSSLSRSQFSLALGLGLGLGANETAEEARAIGRVLTPEQDPFKRLDMWVPKGTMRDSSRSVGSAESIVDEELVDDWGPSSHHNSAPTSWQGRGNLFGSGGRSQRPLVPFKAMSGTGTGHTHSSSGETITPFSVVESAGIASDERYRSDISCSSSPSYRFPPPSPSPLQASSSSRSLTLEAFYPLPDSPNTPSTPLSPFMFPSVHRDEPPLNVPSSPKTMASSVAFV
ncbi:hypothetical protein BDW22DRAFT_1355847 [Trametopsis cervina]|nr:hypothetical protein BDW22DRAFT_1355847 [Trametopsis cervina]